ncbi:uncharacterized protein Dwil_GK25047 [Drosophila willistoni]|uniref:Aldose 1-epimerase n=1 Tax=Drosophila willistoni TaxID=7260 RepID=B4NCP3_DROWI|nr:galactose mutarotase [Drosophila willistoni]EDW82602.1 uncharacterized protein Dwil_GK25047 [Drosophila willistoni]
MAKVVEDIFGIAINPLTNMAQVVRRYTISNTNRLSISVIQLGASIQSIYMPDAYHNVEDVVLGFDDVAGYLQHSQSQFGCTLGRLSGQVANGEFIMDEKRVSVTKNLNNKHQTDGGFIGFDSIIWDLDQIRPDGITLRHISDHGHEGYPGKLTVLIHYTIDDDNRFYIRIEARTDRPTAVNISNHIYFNLAGHKAGPEGIYEHRMVVEADHIIELNAESLPTGKFKRVDDTINDIRLPVFIGDRVRRFETLPSQPTRQCEVCYAMDKEFDANVTKFVGRFLHPPSGRLMEIYSNQPGLRFSVANDFPKELRGDDAIMGKQCTRYWQYSGFSLQLQKFPDSVNQLDFPTVFILPSENYFHETVFRFGIQESWKCCAEPHELEEMDAETVRTSYI